MFATRLNHFDAHAATVARTAALSAATPAELRDARDLATAAGVMTLGLALNVGTRAERAARIVARIDAAIAGQGLDALAPI